MTPPQSEDSDPVYLDPEVEVGQAGDKRKTRKWRLFQEELPVDQIQVPRWMWTRPPAGRTEIHGFADASERTYAAVVYLRTTGEGDDRVLLMAPFRDVTSRTTTMTTSVEKLDELLHEQKTII